MKLYEFIYRHRKAFLFTTLVCALSGVGLLLNLPVSLFPDVTFPRIVILADNGEEPAERMMVEVTKPLEEVASAIPGVRLVRSVTGRGSTEISISLDWGQNIQQALQMLQGRIANIRNSLPPEASIRAEQMMVSVFPVLGYSLTSDSLDQVQLRDIAMYQIRPALLQVKEVARVEIDGGDTREFCVTISPEKLNAHHLDIRQVADAVQKSNFISSPGLVTNNYQMYLSLVSGLFVTSEDIQSVVVSVRNGIPVCIRDIADVKPAAAERLIRTTARGRDAVLINILRQPSGNTVRIGQEVNAVLSKLQLPRGVHFENFYDQGRFISNSIAGTRDSIMIGILLAMIVVIVALRNWRMTIVMLCVVPTTLAITFACLYALGLSINIMTLGGIAAAVGLIIDDSVVMIENIFSRTAERHTSKMSFTEVVAVSIRDLMPAILGSTASTIVIHIPLAFLGGVTGAFFASLSITMVCAMLLSFFFSITLAPLLVTFLLKPSDRMREEHREQMLETTASRYGRMLSWLLAHRWAAIAPALVILLAAWFAFDRLGSSFMPEMDEGTFVLDYNSPPGTSLDETNHKLMNIEKILLATPEVESYSRRTGTQLGFFLTEPNSGDYLVKLKEERHREITEVIADVRQQIETVEPSVRVEFGQLMMDVIGDLTNNPSPVEIKLFSDDTKALRAKAAEVKSLIETIPGVVDAFDGIVISGPSLLVKVDPMRAARGGFTAEDVQQQLETMIHGRAETAIQRGEKLIRVRTRYPFEYQRDIEKMKGLQLVNAAGGLVPLSSIASIERTAGQSEVVREGLRQMVAITARIEGRDLGHTVDDIKKLLSAKVSLPTGMTLEYGGVYKTQQDSFHGLLLVSLTAVLLVFIVLLFEFGEFAVPVSILAVNVLSLVGVFGTLLLAGVTLNISSFVGIIMIIGIVAENAIFVMHQVHRLRREGATLDEALCRGGSTRIRPILMTTLAAVFALLPLSLGIGSGARLQQPLAIAVIGGFSVSSILIFFGLPIIYKTILELRGMRK